MYPQGIRAKINLALQRLAIGNTSVITDSHTSKKDLIRYFHLNDDQINVIPLAIDPTYYDITPPPPLKLRGGRSYPIGGDTDLHLPSSFILYVGGANPNKNLISLSKACEANNIPLVLVGSEFTKPPKETFSVKKLLSLEGTHPENETYQYLAPKIKNGEIIALGFVPTEQLKAIYKKPLFTFNLHITKDSVSCSRPWRRNLTYIWQIMKLSI
jgi:hypothetical protein